MDLVRELIKENIFSILKKKKEVKNDEMRKYIRDQISYFRLHSDEHDRGEVMKFFQSLMKDVQEKFGKVCVPSVSNEDIEDIIGAYLEKFKII